MKNTVETLKILKSKAIFKKHLKKLFVVYSIFSLVIYSPASVFAQTASDSAIQNISTATNNAASSSDSAILEKVLNDLPSGINPTSTDSPSLILDTTQFPSANLHQPTFIGSLNKRFFKAEENVSLLVQNADINNIETKLIYSDGQEVFAEIQEIKQGDNTEIRVIPSSNFKPGKYKLLITANGQTSEQDFSWGVLVINTNKSIYSPNESANLAMAVLDDGGDMVCNAQLDLYITDPSMQASHLSTDNGQINVSENCNLKIFSLVPDYAANYTVGMPGKYLIVLDAQTDNGNYSIDDSFEVRANLDFDVERITATRIYPPLTYPVTLKIKANRDFRGVVRESVPQSFDISKLNGVMPYEEQSATDSAKQVLGVSTTLSLPFEGSHAITEGFGVPLTEELLKDVYYNFGLAGHDGLDFDLSEGSSVLSVDNGQIIGANPNGDYGETIIIQHSWGKSYYGHLSKFFVKKGDIVEKGEQIALSGSTGKATGPHLHFGIQINDSNINNGYFGKVDPAPYLGLTKEEQALGALTSNSLSKTISWNVSVKKGEEISLGYQFKAPNQSPELYKLGPLSFFEDASGVSVFREVRQWQIAADAVGDFQSRATGNWSDITTWVKFLTGTAAFTLNSTAVVGTSTLFTTELSNGDVLMLQASTGTIRGTVSTITDDTHLTLVANASATASGAYGKEATPTSSDGAITIAGHAITVTADVTVDQVSFSSGSTLTINNGVVFTVADGTGNDLSETNATITINGTMTTNSGATIGGGGGNGGQAGSLSVGSGGILNLNGLLTRTTSTVPITLSVTGTMNVSSTGSTSIITTLIINSGGIVNVTDGSIVLASVSNLTVSSGGALNIAGAGVVSGTRGNGGNVISISGTATLTDTSTISALASGTLTVNSGGIINLGPSTKVTGNIFTLASGGNIKIGSTAGITSSGATGNVQTSTRNYNTGANYTYDGTADQNTGNGLPTTVNNLTISNTSGVVTIGSTAVLNETISATMQVDANAIASPSAATIIKGAAGTLTGSGTVKMSRAEGTAGTIDFNSQYPINTVTLTNLTVDYVSTGSATVNALSYNNLKVEPEANSVTHTFATNGTIVGGNLTLGDGTHTGIIVDASVNNTTLTITGSFTNNANTEFKANANNPTTVNGDFTNNGTFTHNSGTVVFNGSGIQILAGSGNPAVTFNNLTLSSGQTVKFTAGETFRTNGLLTISNTTNINSTNGTQWFINHQGTETVTAGIIANSGCNGSTEITVTSGTDGLNNGSCWAFSGAPSGPSLNQLMRHGEWFNSSQVRQPFTF